jgi:hypothetical protein
VVKKKISEKKQTDIEKSKFESDDYDCPDLSDFMSDYENDEGSDESDSDDDCPELMEDSGSDSDTDDEVFLPAKSTFPVSTTSRNNAVPCCNCHAANAKCVNCRCKRQNIQCTNCKPLIAGKCRNSHVLNSKDENKNPPNSQTQSNNILPTHSLPPIKEELAFVDKKMIEAFGHTLSGPDSGVPSGRLENIWYRAVKLSSKLYRLPGGSVGRKFVGILANEIDLLASAINKSERCSMFGRLILQKENKVRKSADIRRCVIRRIKLWEEDKLEELIQEAELCERKLGKSMGENMSDDTADKVFNTLILQGKIREATRFITQRGEKTAILKPDDDDGKGNKVIDVLKSKHPAQAEANPEAFLECDKLPSLLDVDITASHVEKIAKVLSGSAGISGLDSQQWHSMLLKFGKISEHLRESIAALTRRLA